MKKLILLLAVLALGGCQCLTQQDKFIYDLDCFNDGKCIGSLQCCRDTLGAKCATTPSDIVECRAECEKTITGLCPGRGFVSMVYKDKIYGRLGCSFECSAYKAEERHKGSSP